MTYHDDHHRKRIITIDVNSLPVIFTLRNLLGSPEYKAANTDEKRANTILATLRRYAEAGSET